MYKSYSNVMVKKYLCYILKFQRQLQKIPVTVESISFLIVFSIGFAGTFPFFYFFFYLFFPELRSLNLLRTAVWTHWTGYCKVNLSISISSCLPAKVTKTGWCNCTKLLSFFSLVKLHADFNHDQTPQSKTLFKVKF